MFDVAVVGGGPAGAVAAYVLARAGRRVALVDASSGASAASGARKIGESLPAIAGRLLRELGLAEVLEGHRPSFGNVSAWGGEELVATDFIQDPHGLGWHLDRARFDRELRAAAASAGAEVLEARVREAGRGAEGWTLRLEAVAAPSSTAFVSAACVVDATGRRAAIARREGAKRVRDDALVALFRWGAGSGADERTLVESRPEGWWYTAPLPNDARVLAFHTDADLARALRRGAGLDAALATTTHIAPALEGFVLSGSDARGRAERAPEGPTTLSVRDAEARGGEDARLGFHVVEACGARLDAFVGRGWVAVGDAALSFDPLAAQGIFNALYTGMKAGEAVDAALRGDPSGLSQYTRRLEEIRAAYLERRVHVYDLEARWPDAPFWRRRRP